MQFAAALKHEERERERAEISAPQHRKYHSFRARVSSSCSSWVSAAALPASQRRLNRKKDCFRTKEEKKTRRKKGRKKKVREALLLLSLPHCRLTGSIFLFFFGEKRRLFESSQLPVPNSPPFLVQLFLPENHDRLLGIHVFRLKSRKEGEMGGGRNWEM